jgi:hypothetical protein
LTFESRCEKHKAEYEKKRGAKYDTPERQAKKQFLYGRNYKTKRALVLSTATHCHLCQQPFTATDKIETDHLFPELGSASPLAAAHRACNQSRGNKPLQN